MSPTGFAMKDQLFLLPSGFHLHKTTPFRPNRSNLNQPARRMLAKSVVRRVDNPTIRCADFCDWPFLMWSTQCLGDLPQICAVGWHTITFPIRNGQQRPSMCAEWLQLLRVSRSFLKPRTGFLKCYPFKAVFGPKTFCLRVTLAAHYGTLFVR